MNRAVQFLASDGRRYVVYDVLEIDGKGKKLELEAPAATHRIFQPQSGAKLAYRFKPGDDHLLTRVQLQQQIGCAGYIGKHLYAGPDMSLGGGVGAPNPAGPPIG